MSIDASEGRWVTRGTSLVSIDSRRVTLSLEAKAAEAAQARAEADLARKELARAEDLFEQEILPQRTLDMAQAEAIRAEERYRQLEAERKQLDLDVANCSIRAPYAGFTVEQLVQVGEWVNPGTSVYVTVDLSVVKVTVDLPERSYGQVEVGSSVLVNMSGDDDAPLEGKVTGLAPQASTATHTFPVIVSVPNKEGRLGGGMLVKATVSLKRRFSSLAVSKDAIVRQGEQTMVYTIVDGKAAPIPVRLSSSEGMMVAVEGEGLTEGMPVVVRGNERVFPGSPVQDAAAAGQNAEAEAKESAASGNEADGEDKKKEQL
jgi:RND family efflux transporter MFP subunit